MTVPRLGRLALALFCLQGLLAVAQTLVVNGRPVAGLALLKGSSYAPADAFGAALGAETFYDAALQTATFSLAGRLVSVTLGDGPGAVGRDGVAFADEGGVLEDGLFYVPVKPVVAALGGTVTWLPSQQTVMAVLPRAELRGVRVDASASDYERLVLDFDGLSPFDTYFNRALGTLQLRFERADLGTSQTFSGRYFTDGVATPNAGYLDVRVTLQPGYRFESYTSPRSGGFTVVVDLLPEAVAAVTAVNPARPLVVIDPGHGGADAGLLLGSAAEKDLTLRFALALEAALASADVNVRLTRRDDLTVSPGSRSQAGVGARMFVSLHAANLPAGQFNLYYLGDGDLAAASAGPLRDNAAAALDTPDTDAVRRRILLDFVPDLALGERYARSLSTVSAEPDAELGGATQAALVAPAPLAVLYGAAGRGVLLELSPDDLADETLAARFAAALLNALSSDAD